MDEESSPQEMRKCDCSVGMRMLNHPDPCFLSQVVTDEELDALAFWNYRAWLEDDGLYQDHGGES